MTAATEVTDRWPVELAATVHRLVQESLTNVLRHAPGAGAVAVSVDDDGSVVRVEVVDDGQPAGGPGARVRRPGYGLTGMAERVELLGGSFAAGPLAGDRGWSVRVELPWPGGRR